MPEGRVQTLVGGGAVTWLPDWAPSGNHFLFSQSSMGSGSAIVDRSTTEGFSRHVAESPTGGLRGPRWSPDGTRFLFIQGGDGQSARLSLASASGGRWTELLDGVNSQLGYAWSPDGEWVAVQRLISGKWQLVKLKPIAGGNSGVAWQCHSCLAQLCRDPVISQWRVDRLSIGGRYLADLSRWQDGSQTDGSQVGCFCVFERRNSGLWSLSR